MRGETANAGRLVQLFEESQLFAQAAPRSPTTKIQPGPGRDLRPRRAAQAAGRAGAVAGVAARRQRRRRPRRRRRPQRTAPWHRRPCRCAGARRQHRTGRAGSGHAPPAAAPRRAAASAAPRRNGAACPAAAPPAARNRTAAAVQPRRRQRHAAAGTDRRARRRPAAPAAPAPAPPVPPSTIAPPLGARHGAAGAMRVAADGRPTGAGNASAAPEGAAMTPAFAARLSPHAAARAGDRAAGGSRSCWCSRSSWAHPAAASPLRRRDRRPDRSPRALPPRRGAGAGAAPRARAS